jgi:hypothetical protein
MPRLSHKGISTPPKTIEAQVPALFTWLLQLQLVFPNITTYEESINVANIGATSYSTQTFTVTGLDVNDVITVNPPAFTAGLYLISYMVSAADTLSMTFYNSTGGAINEAAATYKIMACKL